jgi:sugar diacid utilization regulator
LVVCTITLHSVYTLRTMTDQYPIYLRPSARLRRLVTALLRRLDELSADVVKALQANIPEYAVIRDESLLNEVFALTREGLSIAFESFLEGQPPSEQRFKRVASLARNRVDQKIPLDALLRGLRVGWASVWTMILDAAHTNSALRNEVLFKLSSMVLHQIDLLSQVVHRAYMTELSDRLRQRDRIKHEFTRLLLAEEGDEQTLRAQALQLGLDPGRPCSALAIELRNPERAMPFPSAETTALLEGLADVLKVATADLVEALHERKLLLWVPHPPASQSHGATGSLEVASRTLLAKHPEVGQIGIGTPLRGLGRWRITGVQALKALEIGKVLDPSRQVYRYADIAIYDAVSGAPEVAELLGGLLDGLSGDAELLRSAEIYFARGCNLKATAEQLGIHRNTLQYRLHRIENLLGGRFRDSDWSLRLQLAIKVRHMTATASI